MGGKEQVMSEAERRRRLNYKKNRKKMIFIQAIAMAAVALFIAVFALTYIRLDKTYYIDYVENGSVASQLPVFVTVNETW